MSETLTGKDKIQQICDAIRNETIQPAQQESREIIDNAHLEADEILQEAKKNAEKLLQEVQREIEQKKKVFDASLSLGVKQVIDSLKEILEKELLEGSLEKILQKDLSDTNISARVIEAVANALEKEGMDADLIAYIPQTISPEDLLKALKEKIHSKLQKESIYLHHMAGVIVKLKEKNIILDFSDQTLKELLAQYVRKDFHQWIFKEKG